MKSPVPFPRRADRTLLPATLAALLALVLIMQLAVSPAVELPDAAVARPLRLRPIPLVPAVADPVISLRPLFAPGRRETASAMGAGRFAPLDGARAVGVIKVAGATRVFLAGADGQVTRIARGGSYHGWQLVEIGDDRLTFRRDTEIATLTVGAAAPSSPDAEVPTAEPEEEPQ